MFGYLQLLQRWFYAVNPMMYEVEEENKTSNTANPIITMVHDVDEKNNSSVNTVNPINTTVDNVDEKESSINARIEMCSSTTEIDESIKGDASLSLESTARHLQELRLDWMSVIEGLMKRDQFQSGWSMIETLTSSAVTKASLLKRHDALLLYSAIMRIALDIFASRGHLEKPLNSETIERLLGKESEHVPVALELLDSILTDEIIFPELTAEMKDGFDFDCNFLAALKSRYLESIAEEAENNTQSDGSISSNVVIDEVKTEIPELEEAGINALLASDMCSSTAGVDELIRRIASLSLEATANEAERIIQFDASISSDVEIDAKRTGRPEIEEAGVHALLDSVSGSHPFTKKSTKCVMVSGEILG